MEKLTDDGLFRKAVIPFLFLILIAGLPPVQADTKNITTLTIMSSRKASLINPVLQKYIKEHGIAINFLYVSDQEMLKAFEMPERHKVDIYLANDMAALYAGERAGAFQPILSGALEHSVPHHYRSSDNLWFASTARARAIIYNPDKVQASQLLSYATLATPHWQGRLCFRDGYNKYNLFLISSLIHRYGEDNTTLILQGWKRNLAIPVTKKDSHAIKAVAEGTCDVTIANHYYFTRLKAKQPDIRAAIFWPDQKAQGVHLGLSGFALAKDSQKTMEAIALLEWLAGKEGQQLLTNFNDEFPINPNVPDSKAAAILGTFKKDQLPLDKLVDHVISARRLVEKVGLGL